MESLVDKIIADKTLLSLGVAVIGLVGIVVGTLLTGLKEWLFERSKTRKEAEYLAIRIVFMLDRFVHACVGVAFDDGLYQGSYPDDGRAVAQVKCPSFEPELVQLDWKSLPVSLTYEIFNFPNHVSDAENMVSAVCENDHPPDFSDGFAERQFQYAKLGIGAATLATKLREKMSLPKREISEWDPLKHLCDVKMKIDSQRAERDHKHAEMMVTLNLESLV